MPRGSYSPKYQERPCWWCGKPLATQGYREIHDHDGNPVLVHACCEDAALEEITEITAQPNEWPLSPVFRA